MILKFNFHGLALNSVFFLIIAQPGIFCKKCRGKFLIKFEIWERSGIKLHFRAVRVKLKY